MKITHLAGIALLAVVSTTPASGQNRINFASGGLFPYDPAAAIYVPEAPRYAAALQPAATPAPAAEAPVPPAPAAETPPPPAPAPETPPPAPAAEAPPPPAPASETPPPPAPVAEPPAAPAEAKPAPAAPPAESAPPPPPAQPVPPAPKPENAIASPSDAPKPPVVEAPKMQLDQQPETPAEVESPLPGKPEDTSCDAGYCDDGCTFGSCGGWLCNPGKQWKLPQPGFLQQHKTVLGGWLQQGITFNNQNSDGFNGPVATNDLAAEYQMNQMWLYLHRPADNGGCGFAWGGHVDIMYGTDGRFGINKGLEDRIYGFDRETYGIVIPQFYLELAYNDLSVKLGHFAGILDYEAVPGPMNPFYSHSYCYGYTVPQLVTGFLADYKLTDQLSLQGGMHRGWMQFEDYNDNWDVMAGIKWQSDDKQTEVRYAISSGKQSMPFDDENRFVYSLVLQHQLSEKLKYVLVQNLGVEENIAEFNGADAEWYGVNQYLLYTINKCWAANLRIEWLRDDDGARVAGPGNMVSPDGVMNGVRAWDGAGYAGNFYELTLGLNWRPTGNWLVRPEVRWDWYNGLASPKPNNQLPFGQGTSADQTTFAVDAIFSF